MNFDLINVKKTTWAPPPELLKEMKDAECNMFLYKSRTKLAFAIKRNEKDKYDGFDLVKFANCVRRYINARVPTYILDFIPNHEQRGGVPVVREVGATCLINEVRNSLNGVVVRQIKSTEYELHLINDTPFEMAIMTGNIKVKGSDSKEWHDNFAPGHIIGTLLPAAELHIDSIFMKQGCVYSDQLITFKNGELINPDDRTHFMHNGLTEWRQPDMVDSTGVMKNPLINAPNIVEMEIPLQPYTDPHDILIRALKQLSSDLKILITHGNKARGSATESKGELSDEYAFGNINITIVGNDLTCVTNGFDASIGIVIAANAKLIAGDTITHFTSHLVHPTKKEVVIRLSCPAVRDIFEQAIYLSKARVDSILAQALKYT